MSTKELYFPSALTIGLGPGVAVEVRAGEVLAVPGEIVATLVKRKGVVEAGADHVEARRVSIEERRLPAERAAFLSPPLDDDRLLADNERAIAAMELRKKIANLSRSGGRSAAA